MFAYRRVLGMAQGGDGHHDQVVVHHFLEEGSYLRIIDLCITQL